MSFLNLPVRTLVAACGLSLLSLAAHADSFRGDAHAPQQAAVATPHPAATVAGLETLANGGNAFDAAAAIAAALAVAEPYGSGLGGGGFFLLRQAGAQPTYRFLDARERAPKAAYADMYRRNGKVDPRLSVDGPLAAAIPIAGGAGRIEQPLRTQAPGRQSGAGDPPGGGWRIRRPDLP